MQRNENSEKVTTHQVLFSIHSKTVSFFIRVIKLFDNFNPLSLVPPIPASVRIAFQPPIQKSQAAINLSVLATLPLKSKYKYFNLLLINLIAISLFTTETLEKVVADLKKWCKETMSL
jgi:hypothetical protein